MRKFLKDKQDYNYFQKYIIKIKDFELLNYKKRIFYRKVY